MLIWLIPSCAFSGVCRHTKLLLLGRRAPVHYSTANFCSGWSRFKRSSLDVALDQD